MVMIYPAIWWGWSPPMRLITFSEDPVGNLGIPHLAFWPGLALTVTLYSLNMLGDAVRDLLDPRLIGGAGRLGAQAARSV